MDLLQATARERHLLPDFSSPYLDHLVSLPLPTLLREPSQISSEASTVESELTNLCFREYSTFISVHRCSAAVRSAFDDFEGSLGRLFDSVPALEEECRAFGKGTQGIQAVRGRAALVQEHQDKLLDLLELPQLLETCVRNGYYQEAMELAAHAVDLKARYPLALVEDVAKEVDGVIQLMLAQLLALLREPVKLPTLIKAVTYLRRLGSMDEEELGLAFLASRLHNYRAQLVQIERDRTEPIRYLRKYIDLFRENVYDIISQHTAIFTETFQLTSFASLCVTELVHLVANCAPKVGDAAAMSSILVQLGYCAMSFARVGLDFSALIGGPFVETVRSSYSQAIDAAATSLVTTLRNAAKNAASPSDVLVSPEHRAAALSQTDDIAHFPLLTVFTNAHLSALNGLRFLAPVRLFPELVTTQTASLVASTMAILQYVQQAISSPEVNGDRPKHTRTPSSPRAHLLRRNTETLLAPEVRAARRREAVKICVGFARAWGMVVDMIANGLTSGIYERNQGVSRELEGRLAELAIWMEQNKLKEPNGVIAETSERPGLMTNWGINGHAPDSAARSLVVDTSLHSSADVSRQQSPNPLEADANGENRLDNPLIASYTPTSPIKESKREDAMIPHVELSLPEPEATQPNGDDLEAPSTAIDRMFTAGNLDVVPQTEQAPPLPVYMSTRSIVALQEELEAMDAGLTEVQTATPAKEDIVEQTDTAIADRSPPPEPLANPANMSAQQEEVRKTDPDTIEAEARGGQGGSTAEGSGQDEAENSSRVALREENGLVATSSSHAVQEGAGDNVEGVGERQEAGVSRVAGEHPAEESHEEAEAGHNAVVVNDGDGDAEEAGEAGNEAIDMDEERSNDMRDDTTVPLPPSRPDPTHPKPKRKKKKSKR